LEKARELDADCLILDLEDAVAPEAKEMARSEAAAAARAGYGNREVIIRTNGIETEWFKDDAAAVAGSNADAVLLPKVESAAAVNDALRQLATAGAPSDLPVWVMTETPRGVLDLEKILTSCQEIRVIVMGTSDLAKELRAPNSGDRAGLLHSLGHCLLTARAHGLDIIDGVHLALDDADGFRTACQQGHDLGFDGKSLIHPRQIATANELFGVSEAAAEDARAIVQAWELARKEGQGITVLNGRLIERLHVDEAERVLALHAAANE
ncbi:MAG: HpcH/HpaI aldolase/citrate lyase family protein, partial [Gammaproteobacteria bacterium]